MLRKRYYGKEYYNYLHFITVIYLSFQHNRLKWQWIYLLMGMKHMASEWSTISHNFHKVYWKRKPMFSSLTYTRLYSWISYSLLFQCWSLISSLSFYLRPYTIYMRYEALNNATLHWHALHIDISYKLFLLNGWSMRHVVCQILFYLIVYKMY